MASADTVEAKDKAGPSRPPARASTNPSQHHLEPNPFEQSFSSKPSDQASASPEGSKSSDKTSGRKSTKLEAGIKQEAEEAGHSEKRNVRDVATGRSNGPLTPSANQTPTKRILPPVSSIASPAPHEASSVQYPWGSSLTGSLRSGPLSPAMLAGPQSSFDVSSFRSGFTPDLSNFKTGLTPLGASGTSFPPPSPNTAAFLAMVTNSSGQGLSGATITPNTLSALSGNPMDSHANHHSLVSSHPGQNGDSSKAASGEHQDHFDFAFGRSMQETPTKGSSRLRMSTGGDGRSSGSEFADAANVNGQHQQHSNTNTGANAHQNQQQTSQAASGLFLLSQAHQELAKREDAAAAAAAAHGSQDMNSQRLYSSNDPSRGIGAGGSKANKGVASVPGKRKKSSEPSTGSHKVGTGKKVKTKSEDGVGEEQEGYESDELDEDGNRVQKSSNGDAGDDEEKRKSFLERNRQAALKCRQRKKAWLASLQAKVEYLQSDNENLQGTVSALRNEVMFLKSQLMQAQRQMNGPHPVGGMLPNMDGSAAVGADRNGSISMQGVTTGHPGNHNMNRQGQPHGSPPSNLLAAAAASNVGANRVGNGSGQYQAHAVPRPTHIPGQPNAQQYGQTVQRRQDSAQAA